MTFYEIGLLYIAIGFIFSLLIARTWNIAGVYEMPEYQDVYKKTLFVIFFFWPLMMPLILLKTFSK